MATPELRYGFGANWKHFVEVSLNEARIANAVQSLRDLLALENLSGQSFLDIGCGSGLFSLAACRLDAARVISFDFDALSATPGCKKSVSAEQPKLSSRCGYCSRIRDIRAIRGSHFSA